LPIGASNHYLSLPVEVVHGRPEPHGAWFHGCLTARQLRGEELLAIIGPDRTEPVEGVPREMDESGYVLLLRPKLDGSLSSAEQLLGSYATLAEARRVQREFQRSNLDCIVRYIGLSGGG